MAEQNQRQPIRLSWMIGAALLLAAALVALYLSFRAGGKPACPPEVAPVLVNVVPGVATNQTDAAAELRSRIAGLEQRRQELAQTRGIAFREARDRQELAEQTNTFLKAEIQALQQEFYALVDAHPVMVAHRGQMQQALDQTHVADTNAAEILTRLNACQAAEQKNLEQALAAAEDIHRQARQELLQEMGVNELRLASMTPAQAERLGQLDQQQGELVRALREQALRNKENPSDEVQELKRMFQQMNKEIAGYSEQYKSKYVEGPSLRAQVGATDPSAVALGSRISALLDRRRQMLDATPEVVEAQKRYREVEQQQADLILQMQGLKSQLRRVIAEEARPVAGRNGQD